MSRPTPDVGHCHRVDQRPYIFACRGSACLSAIDVCICCGIYDGRQMLSSRLIFWLHDLPELIESIRAYDLTCVSSPQREPSVYQPRHRKWSVFFDQVQVNWDWNTPRKDLPDAQRNSHSEIKQLKPRSTDRIHPRTDVDEVVAYYTALSDAVYGYACSLCVCTLVTCYAGSTAIWCLSRWSRPMYICRPIHIHIGFVDPFRFEINDCFIKRRASK